MTVSIINKYIRQFHLIQGIKSEYQRERKFDKGKQKFSEELYTIDKREGYKLIVNGNSRKLKPAELFKTTTTANPIYEKYIQDKKEERKAGKVINSLVRNAKMTPEEAKAAAVKVQDAPKQPRAGRIVSKYDKNLGNQKKNNIIVLLKIL